MLDSSLFGTILMQRTSTGPGNKCHAAPSQAPSLQLKRRAVSELPEDKQPCAIKSHSIVMANCNETEFIALHTLDICQSQVRPARHAVITPYNHRSIGQDCCKSQSGGLQRLHARKPGRRAMECHCFPSSPRCHLHAKQQKRKKWLESAGHQSAGLAQHCSSRPHQIPSRQRTHYQE